MVNTTTTSHVHASTPGSAHSTVGATPPEPAPTPTPSRFPGEPPATPKEEIAPPERPRELPVTGEPPGEIAQTRTATETASPPLQVGAEQPRQLKPWETVVVSAWMVLLTGATVVCLLSLWPLAEQVRAAASGGSPGTASPEPPRLDLLVAHPLLTVDVSLIVISMLAGVLGSLVHTFTWLNQSGGTPPANGRRPHTTHDLVWFVTAPIQGGLLAAVVLAAVAAGLLSAGQAQAAGTINLFTIAALGSLTGLFSRRITAKLAQVVNRIGPPASTTIVHPAGAATTTTTTTDQATSHAD